MKGKCHEWPGGRISSGYGAVRVKGKQQLAHRVAWEQAHGRIPKGKLVLHRCDNKICVNPQHLFLGSHANNTHDMVAKGRWKGNVKLTIKEVARIRKLYQAGTLQRTLATQFAVTQAHVSNIVRKQRWS
jgi:hypothetical protein